MVSKKEYSTSVSVGGGYVGTERGRVGGRQEEEKDELTDEGGEVGLNLTHPSTDEDTEGRWTVTSP